jgi:hypothetical protein
MSTLPTTAALSTGNKEQEGPTPYEFAMREYLLLRKQQRKALKQQKEPTETLTAYLKRRLITETNLDWLSISSQIFGEGMAERANTIDEMKYRVEIATEEELKELTGTLVKDTEFGLKFDAFTRIILGLAMKLQIGPTQTKKTKKVLIETEDQTGTGQKF